MARLSYVDVGSAPDPPRGLLERIAGDRGYAFNVYRMLAHSPMALERVYGLAYGLWNESAVDPRLLELVILRTAQLTGSDYEWGRHRKLAARVGVPDEQVGSLAAWRKATGVFDARERSALALTDELVTGVEAQASTLAAVREHFDERETVELVLLAGFYAMMARFLRTLAVDLEDSDEALR